ncbi:MaoC/PaaZ C-terminal domain-containing protein [uncultured Ruegeria sp.]|uniref:MaoC/PaaZ C-terminal domain-containing protein n=1 Tax=uncultured Ruegeria sp. TaxID=259304 RepID=UPI00261C5D78|nr:MaoC/PaaZ C-terminal domain-containing protein [uncultured Ruegeria sp.]
MNIEKLAGISVPGPTIIPLTKPFWASAETGVLTTQKCGTCGTRVFYPRGRCPVCWSDALDWVTVSGVARLKSFSEVWKPGNEGWIPATPYVVGLVTLEEGPTLLSTILCDQVPQIGATLHFVPFNIGGRVLPCFHNFTEEEAKDMADQGKDGWAGVVNGKPKIGDAIERKRTTRMEDIHAFTEMTGDRNPVHYDEALAKKTPFGKLIVQGGVTTGMLNACVAEDLPGPGTVFLNTNLNFLKAVGVGEDLTARVEIETVRDDKPICKLKVRIVDSAGDPCVEGEATTYTMALEGL